VIEVATPIVEVEHGCCYRATRLLWEQIRYLRRELDHWARRHSCQCSLQGFSTHYNFSFPETRKSKFRNATKLAYLLAHILPVPVLLLATNRRSSAVGVRPRRTRLEVTADFTPDPPLMLATCAFIMGVIEKVQRWESFGLGQLRRNMLPRITPFRLQKHSSGRRRNRRRSRSKYEKIIHRVIAREPFRVGQKRYRVVRMNGWYHVDFREVGTNRRRTFNLDQLVQSAASKKAASKASRNRKAARGRQR
jgi:hypothetical protein